MDLSRPTRDTPRPGVVLRGWAAAALAVALLGCSEPARFAPHDLVLAEQQVVPTHREQIGAVLAELFGQPSEPAVPDSLSDLLNLDQLRHAAGRVASNRPGQTLGLYRRHCAVCHGLGGDGQGPAALYESPYPRDFRSGVFKFKSTFRGAAPTDADLAATLRFGLPGSAMPAFGLLPPEEIEALVQYVKYLAIRGQLEQALARYVGEELDFDPITGEVGEDSLLDWSDGSTRDLVLNELLPPILGWWRDAGASVVPAAAPTTADSPFPAEWVDSGRQLFHDAKRANCMKCHGEDGAGGTGLVDYNDWNGRRHNFVEQTTRLEATRGTLRERLAGTAAERRDLIERQLAELDQQIKLRDATQLVLLPPRVADPRRLAPGTLRGVRSREDLFRIVSQGIAGTPMPAVGPTDAASDGVLSDEEIWRLVAYVESLTGGADD